MTGDGTWKTDTDIGTARTVSGPPGTGADITVPIGVHTGADGHTAHGDITVSMTLGTAEDSMTHGTMADSTTRGITAVIGDGTTHGTTTTTITDGMTLTITVRSEVHLIPEDMEVSEGNMPRA